jgi:hypothetical protein
MKLTRASRRRSGQTGPAAPASQQVARSDEELAAQVAQLASELSEADSPSLRHKLARAIPELARPRRQTGSPADEHVGAATERQADLARRARGQRLHGTRRASGERIQSAGRASARRIQSASQASWKGLQAGGQASWKGLQATGRVGARGVTASGRWLASQVITMAPRIPIRNLETLRAQHPGKSTEQIADSLIDGAARAAAGIGVTVGAAVAVPFVPTVPMELGVETLALAAVEIKLIAELHEVYGMRARGSAAERMVAYLGSWAHKRGLSVAPGGVTVAISEPLRRQIERRLAAKAGRSVLSLAPLLAGAAAGGMLNQRETRKLGNKIRDDLRKQAPLVALRPGQR